ncbi:MAG: hypothetical protein HQL68_06620 [Magnetococcales bacterium]|nr:hypothetical protein [Magnetococcales bacterium]
MPNSAITAILGCICAVLLEYLNYLATNKGLTLELWLKDHLIEVATWAALGILVGWIVGSSMTPKKSGWY